MASQNDIIVVIGMGRSGTALACQVLEAIRVSFGKPEHLVGPTEYNERGHYDNGPIHNLNIELLECMFNVPWLFLGELPLNWHTWPVAEMWKQKARGILEEELRYASEEGSLLGIKDPRITRLIPFWNDVFASLELRPRYVFCWRHPDHVYLSCHPRNMRAPTPKEAGQNEQANHFDMPESPMTHRADMYAIWAHFWMDGIAANPDVILKYDNWFLRGYAERQAAELAALVGAEPPTSQQLDAIVDPKMRHHGT